MPYPPITSLGTVPQRTQTPAEFATNADSFLGALPNFRTELNTFGAYIDAAGVAIDADTAAAANSALQSANSASASDASAALALSYKDLAAGTANFKGSWSTLTGALSIPASVYHNGLTWVLLSNLANVTTAEPGVSASWVVASGDSYRRLVDNIFKRATLDLDFSANSHKVYEQFGLEPKQLQSVVVTARNSTATYQSPTGLATAAINTPRITYDAATGNALGLLGEEQRTNLLLHSQYTAASGEAPPTGWTMGATTGTTTTAASPRVSGAVRVTNTGTTQREYYNQTVTLAAATTYTLSCYFAAGTSAGSNIMTALAISDTPTGQIALNGSAVTAPGVYSITFTTVSGGTYNVRIGLGTNADATGTVIHETPQLEVGSFPTSYIPTTTAQVTRVADQISATLPALSEGTIFVTATGPAAVSGKAFALFTLSDGTTNNRVLIRRNNSLTGTQFTVVSGGSAVADVNGTQKTAGQRNNYAISWKPNQFLAAEDGVIRLNDTSGAVPSNLTQLGIGSAGASASFGDSLNGAVERIVFIPRALTAAELQAITS